MIKVKMLTSVGPYRRGQVLVVEDDSWLASSGYVRVVEVVEESVPEKPKRTRKPKEVADGTDRAESGSGQDLGADSGS